MGKIRNLIENYRRLIRFLYEYQSDMNYIRSSIKFSQIWMESYENQKKVFSKYKKCHENSEIAIIGTGPSLDRWTAPLGCVEMGVNSSFESKRVNLDYLFIQDYSRKMFERLAGYHNSKCKFFFGVHYLVPTIPEEMYNKYNAEKFYFYDWPKEMFPFDFTVDISSKPFITYSSVIFVAAQFALYTHPRRLYIVGCDCSKGHFSEHANINNSDIYGDTFMIEGWRRFARFAEQVYPDVEIVCVNPVGLKGIFKNEITM